VIVPEVGAVIGGLRIDAVAGRGGMGVVYRAYQLALDRTVALKIVNPDLAGDPEFRERFRREARLAASLDHPHVVPVHHAGEDDGHLYLTMRYVDGVDMAAMIAERGRLDPRDAARLVAQVAGALDAAHARGLVHRDVKPANVLVTGPPGARHAFLTDFGISKEIQGGSSVTRTGHVVGSMDYISPEALGSRPVDGRSDVYSLGCVLFHALTGQVPFPRDNTAARMYAHMHTPAPAPSAVVPGIGGAFDAVLAYALAKRPDDRYATAGELGMAAMAAAGSTPAAWSPPAVSSYPRQPTIPPQSGPTHISSPRINPSPGIPSQSNPSQTSPPWHAPAWTPPRTDGQPEPHRFAGPPPAAPPRSRRRLLLAVSGVLAVVALAAGLLVAVPGLTGGTSGPTTTPTAVPTVPAGRVVGDPIPVGAGPIDLIGGAGYIWTADADDGTIARIDPATRAATKIAVSGQPNSLVVGQGKAWVWNYSSAITPVDVTSGKVGELIRTQIDISAIAADDTSVWFLAPDSNAVGRIDMKTGRFTGDLIQLGRRPDSLAIDGTRLYVVSRSDRSLTTIDTTTRAVVGTPRPLIDGIASVGVSGGRVYVFGTAGFGLLGDTPLTKDQLVPGSGVAGIVLDGDTAWLIDEDRNEIRRVGQDLRTPLAAPITGIGAGVGDAEVVNGVLWISSRTADTVTRIDPTPL
jgi:serine/threonine protein kinase/streptogramin lyase